MTKTYELHEAQYQIYEDKSRFIILAAGRRWGKTVLAIVKLMATAFEKKSRCWLICPTYRQAEMIAWKMMQEMIPKESILGRPDQVRLEITLKNGSEICLKGAENEDNLRGVGLEYVVLDEFAMMKPNVWPEIIRPMLTDTQGSALFISTPKGKNEFFNLYLKGRRGEDGYKSYTFKTADNPYILPQEVEEARKQLNERYFRQEFEASFEDFVGLIWPEFSSKDIIEPFYVDKIYPHIGAIDPAITGTTGALKAFLNEDGTIFIYDEYREANQRVSEVAEVIKEKDVRWFIDPSSAGKHIQREGKLYSLYDEFRDCGINAETAENDVDAGINRVAELFKTGKIKIFSTCKQLIWELERYHWSEEKETSSGLMKPKPFKTDDHLCDCLRYMVMAHAHKAVILNTPKIVRGSVAAFLEEDERRENEWREKYQ